MADENHWQLSDIQYPAHELVKTNIKTELLALYQGNFMITANIVAKKGVINNPVKINLNLQACDQNICLAPESLTLFLNPT
jgi:hypothetical protein